MTAKELADLLSEAVRKSLLRRDLDADLRRKIICLDFDGVVHSYSSLWNGAKIIPDPPVAGAIEFVHRALCAGYDIAIHSSRSHQRGGRRAMRRWLREHAGALWHKSMVGPGIESVSFPRHKPPAHVSIDDRAFRFSGEWPSLAEIESFVPWNRTDRERIE